MSQSGLEGGTLGFEPGRRRQGKLKLSVLPPPCTLCRASEAQKLGPEVIAKMENVVSPHDGASLPWLSHSVCSAPHILTPSYGRKE